MEPVHLSLEMTSSQQLKNSLRSTSVVIGRFRKKVISKTRFALDARSTATSHLTTSSIQPNQKTTHMACKRKVLPWGWRIRNWQNKNNWIPHPDPSQIGQLYPSQNTALQHSWNDPYQHQEVTKLDDSLTEQTNTMTETDEGTNNTLSHIWSFPNHHWHWTSQCMHGNRCYGYQMPSW